MYLLDFYQDEEIIEVGLFPCIEEGRKFVKQIPGYEMKEEDGEAVIYRKKRTKDWHFLLHMDPGFVEEENMEAFVEEMLTV